MSYVYNAFVAVHCLVFACLERADLLALVCHVLKCNCHFHMCYLGSGVVHDFIDS